MTIDANELRRQLDSLALHLHEHEWAVVAGNVRSLYQAADEIDRLRALLRDALDCMIDEWDRESEAELWDRIDAALGGGEEA